MRRQLAFLLLLLALLPAAAQAQQAAPGKAQTTGQIAGTVVDTTGAPVLGAQVVVVGIDRGTIAGGSGGYTISGVPPGTYQVKTVILGYAEQQQEVVVAAGERATLNFRLVPQVIALAEIVTVGYGTQRRSDVTGAVGSVRASQITEIAKPNVIDAIKGRIAGVDIVTTGYKPGDGMRIRVRGQRSLKATNDPLFVLDGIPMAGGIGDLNPADLESIEVLKDASATAIYGSRAANGVVLITTRKGLAGSTRITVDSYLGTQEPINTVRMMNGEEFAQLKREAYRTIGKYSCPADVVKCDAGDEALFFPSELESIRQGRSTDWQGLILQEGLQSSNHVSIVGGNERTQFALSGNYFQQDGIVKRQDFRRRSMRVNLEHQVTDRLRAGASAMVTRSEQNLSDGDHSYSEALRADPLGPAFDSTGALIFEPIPDGQSVNVLSNVLNFDDERSRTRAFGTLFASLNLLEGLDWRVNFGPDLTFGRNGRFRGAETQAKLGSDADARVEEDKTYAYTLDNILSYRRSLGEHQRLETTLLYSIQKDRREEHDTEVLGLPYEHQRWYNLGSAGTVNSVRSNLREWTIESYMARVNYALMDRYLLTLTTRVDGSSVLAPGNKYALFPSVAVAWRLGEEPFLRELGWLTDLKLRGSYGRAGNAAVDPYQTVGGLSRTTYSFGDDGAFGYRPGALANPNLTWEKTDQFDVGLEFSLLDSRLSGTIDAYRAMTRDLLMDRQLPPNTGFTSVIENIGETRNTGLEVALSANLLQGGRGPRWTMDATWTTNRNEIVSLYGDTVSDVGNRWFIGHPIDRGGDNTPERLYYDYRFVGIWQSADSAEAARYSQRPGQIRVADICCGPNGEPVPDGKIDGKDRMILGNTYPKWTASLSTRLEWRNFDFSAMAITRQGVMLQNQLLTSQSTMFGRYNNILVDYWLPSNPSNVAPRPNADQESPLYGGARGYQDGSFIKIRNITLGVTLPTAWVQRFGAESVRIYGTAQDPFLFTDFTGLDPEGRTNAGVPSYRTLLVGLSVGM